MKIVEISEAAFVQANTYYLSMWALVVLVAITIFYERRSINLQIEEADRVIEVYQDLLVTAENAQFGLAEIVVGGPTPSKPMESLVALRTNALKLRSLTAQLLEIVKKRTDLAAEDRGKFNLAILRLKSLLHYNDLPLEGAPALDDAETALRMVDSRLGAFGDVNSIGNLTFEDAARYIWLAGTRARSVLAAADDLKLVASEGDIAEALALHINPDVGTQNRALAHSIWLNWFEWSGQDELDEGEKRRFSQLQLHQPRTETDTAQAIKEAAERRRSGDSSTVTLPVLDFPLRLSDAILVLPGLMVSLLFLLWVYLARGRQYAPEKTIITAEKETVMVGKPPVFLLGIRYNKIGGLLLANFMVLLPIGVSIFLWCNYRPPLDWASLELQVYRGVVVVSWLLLIGLIAYEIYKIAKLYDEDIIALGLPPSSGRPPANEN